MQDATGRAPARPPAPSGTGAPRASVPPPGRPAPAPLADPAADVPADVSADVPAGVWADQLAADLAAAVGRLHRRLRSASRGSRLTPSQRSVLTRLAADGPATTAALARAEYVRPQSMRVTLGALQEQGLLARRPDPGDGRQSVVSLTDRGRHVLDTVSQAGQDRLAAALTERCDAAERHTLAEATALLERLAGR